jgi:hypothetical protein
MMRTTLTIDPDVAHALERLRREKRWSLKQAVNDTLRKGLRPVRKSAAARKRFRTRAVNHGRPTLPHFDDIAGVLSLVEGETFK